MLEQKEVKIQVMNKLAFCFKKPVESQYSSLSRKKTHTFTINAMNFVQEQLKSTELKKKTRTNKLLKIILVKNTHSSIQWHLLGAKLIQYLLILDLTQKLIAIIRRNAMNLKKT